MSEEKEIKNIKFNVVRKIATLSYNGKGLSTELRLVEFGANKAKLDLRKWRIKEGQEEPLKGLTLTRDEAQVLATALLDYLNSEND